MYSKILKILICFLLVFVLLAGVSAAQEWTVTSGKDVLANNTSLDELTLRQAISRAASGDTIAFSSQVTEVNLMYGTLNISKDLMIVGNYDQVSIKRDNSSITQEMGIFNITGGNVEFRNLIIENGYTSNSNGGAINVSNATLTLETCIIQRNRAVEGAGLYVTNSNVTMRSTGIYRNTASSEGSAIFVKNGSINMQNCVVDGNGEKGSTITLSQGRLDASNSRFNNNIVTSKGSVIYGAAGTAITLQHSTFKNNSGFDSGGVYTLGQLTVSNCVFDEGKSEKSGAGITLGNGSTGDIRYSIFTNGSAKDDGGGIHVAVDSTATITSCTFADNIANYGGAVFGRGNVTMDSCTAVNNTAKYYGGAIAVWNNAKFTLTKNIITGNKALSNNTVRDVGGGGLNISNSEAWISNNIIVGNSDPRNVDFGQQNATVMSGGQNLVGLYRGDRFPINTTDVDGILPENLFVWSYERPSLTRTTGYTAGYDNVQVYTVELNSSRDNPAYNVLGITSEPPNPGPDQNGEDEQKNQTTPPPTEKPPTSSGIEALKKILIIVAAICVLIIAGVLILRYKKKREYKF